MINEIKELYKIAKEALTAWTKGGFKAKTGNESWLITHYKKERMNEILQELKR